MVDLEVVWRAIKEDLPPMQDPVRRVLDEQSK
jgi:uncharacterized protein with HEPN domain